MRYLFTSDLHFTDRPRDAYRFKIFDFLRTQIKARHITALFILGDLTDQKDHHSARLVNRVVDELRTLDAPWYILKGNHDYVDPALPFFKFLHEHFVSEVRQLQFKNKHGRVVDEFLLMPHSRRYRHRAWRNHIRPGYDFILIHQTVNRAVGENGMWLEGMPQVMFDAEHVGVATVISGDVHVPQRIGRVHYCGSPYPIHFGDNFKSRVLYWNGEQLKSIRHHSIAKRRVLVSHPDELTKIPLNENDQVKVTLQLRRADFGSWKEYRQQVIDWAEKLQIDLCGVDMEEKLVRNEKLALGSETLKLTRKALFLRYCKARKVDDTLLRQGLELLKRRRT